MLPGTLTFRPRGWPLTPTQSTSASPSLSGLAGLHVGPAGSTGVFLLCLLSLDGVPGLSAWLAHCSDLCSDFAQSALLHGFLFFSFLFF